MLNSASPSKINNLERD
jgi:hypothetical protein